MFKIGIGKYFSLPSLNIDINKENLFKDIIIKYINSQNINLENKNCIMYEYVY